MKGTVIIRNATKGMKSTAQDIELLDVGRVATDKIQSSGWEHDKVTVEWLTIEQQEVN